MKERNEKRLKSFAAGLVAGGILAGGGVYATTVSADNVSYSNSSSGLNANNVQNAINALSSKAKIKASKNAKLYEAKYFHECHAYKITPSMWGSCGSREVVTSGYTSTDYVNFLYNLGNTNTSLNGSDMSSRISNCCSHNCGGTTNTCYTICRNGYTDDYLAT